MRTHWIVAVALAATATITASLHLGVLSAQTAPQPGDPLPKLPAELLAAFNEGRRRFVTPETPATGLGPVFNDRSCLACHSDPVPGGTGLTPVTFVTRFGTAGLQASDRFGLQTPSMQFNAMLGAGGPTIQRQSVAADLPGCELQGEVVPRGANAVGPRQPTPLFGLGLIQAIPETAILARADPADVNRDGIAGRANTANGILGRFGWKAQVATVADFVGLALVTEVGITNFLYPNELAPQGKPIPSKCKVTTDPEDADAARLTSMTAFLTYLAPPPRGPITDEVRKGERIFARLRCTACHTPSMKTGPSPNPALDQVDVPLYSDLLTHYLGAALDDQVSDGDVGGGRWRTPPLWGLRLRKFYLHHGQTTDLVQAIALHSGEAAVSRDAFVGMSDAEKADLMAFLKSL